MTQQQRNSLIAEAIDVYTARATVSRKAAREALIAEGIYTKKGELRVEYGGPGGKTKKTKAA